MRRMSAFVVVGVAVTCGLVPLAPETWAVASGNSWGNARAVPGLAALNASGRAQLTSISCPSPGNCVAGGSYRDAAYKSQAFIVSERDGVWGRARRVPGTGSATADASTAVYSVSCPAAGDCTAGGGYEATSSAFVAFVVSERGGVWGKARALSGSGIMVSADSQVDSVSCAAAGDCAAGGVWTDQHGLEHPFVVAERHGVWGRLHVVPGQASALAGTLAVSCPALGDCEAGGFYSGSDFVIAERRGAWGKPVLVPGLSAPGQYSQLTTLSCGAPGSCAAGGWYSDSTGNYPFILTQHDGTWGKAIGVPGMRVLNTGLNAALLTVSCSAPGSCAAGGYYYDGSGGGHAFVVILRSGTWGKAIEVPGLRALNPDLDAQVIAISCAAPGSCAAGGVYYQGRAYAFVVTQQHGTWGKATTVPGLHVLNTGGRAEVLAVSCAAAGSCVAGGVYSNRGQQAFVVSGP